MLSPVGRVVLIGGGADSTARPIAEVYDPRAPTVAPDDHMIARQKGHPVLTLPGGKLDFPDGGALHVQDGTEVRA